MNTLQKTQQGASNIILLLILVIVGSGTYIGLKYLPQYIEASAVDSILGNIEKANKEKPVSSVNDIRDMVDKQLNMNQMDNLKDSFTVTQAGEVYIIRVIYERELNLIYENKPVKYEQSVTLR